MTSIHSFYFLFLKFTEIIFINHQTGDKTYFKRRDKVSMTAAGSYGNAGNANGLWDGVGADNTFPYQLLICDTAFFSGFFFSGYTGCYKQCDSWCQDSTSMYFRTASADPDYGGVAFNTNGHRPNVVDSKLISVGLR